MKTELSETVKLQLKEIFRLTLEIKGCQISLTPDADNVHIFRFIDINQKPAEYDITINGYWSNWCLPDHENSMENCIKNIKSLQP